MHNLIGFHGPKQSGKSTAASVFTRLGYAEVAFADPLKRMMAALLYDLGIPTWEIDRMLWGDLKEIELPELSGRTPRHAMQTLGTEWGRTCMHPGFWVNIVRQQIANDPNQRRVFSDVRFENEAAVIRDLGGIIVHIERPGLPTGDAHASEQGIARQENDIIITNNFGTAQEFACCVEYVLLREGD